MKNPELDCPEMWILGRRLNWSISILICSLILWELLFYVGVVDPVRFSHPIAGIQASADPKFLRGFGLMLTQVIVAFLFGGGIGTVLGFLILRNGWLTLASIRCLRTGMWLPFVIYWALPMWNPREISVQQAFLFAFTVSSTAVALITCYQVIVAGSSLGLKWQVGLRHIARAAILQALLVTLIAQIWMMPHGWEWYFFSGQEGPTATLYAVFVFLVTLFFLLDKLLGLNFEQTAITRATILRSEIQNINYSSLLGSALITLALLIVWQFFGNSSFSPVISSPMGVLRAAWRFVTHSTVIPKEHSNLWSHIVRSLWEVLAGLVLSGGLSLLLYGMVSIRSNIRNYLFPIIPLTNITPIVLSVLIIIWFRLLGSWQTVGGVALLSFFPFLQVLWALRDQPLLCRMLLAIDDSLPFAFIAMLFGEAMSAVGGLGFLMMFTHTNTNMTDEGLAVAVVTFALLIALSSAARVLAKHSCLQR